MLFLSCTTAVRQRKLQLKRPFAAEHVEGLLHFCHQGCLSSANHQPEVRNNLRAVSAEPFSQVPSRKTLDCLPRLTRSQTRSNARGIRASSLTSLSPLPSGAQRQRRCADDLGSTIDFPSSGPLEGLQPQKSSCLCFYCSKSDRPMLGAAASRWLCERLCSVARRLSFSGAVTILKYFRVCSTSSKGFHAIFWWYVSLMDVFMGADSKSFNSLFTVSLILPVRINQITMHGLQ